MSTDSQHDRDHEEEDFSAGPDLPPMPRPVQENPILKKCVWRRFKQNKNFVAGVVGETGSGKSWGALRLAEAVDPTFGIDQVAFHIDEFLELVNGDEHGSGSMIVFDEAAVEASHQRWYDDANYLFQTVLQTWRHQNRGALFTMPELDKLSKPARSRLQAYIEMVDIDQHAGVSKAKYQRVQTNPRTGKNYYKYPRLRWHGATKKWKGIRLTPPSKELREAYEKKKESFTDDLNQSAIDALGDEDDGDQRSDPKDLASEILASDTVDQYISNNHGQRYIDKDLIELEHDVNASVAGKVKKLLLREVDDDNLV